MTRTAWKVLGVVAFLILVVGIIYFYNKGRIARKELELKQTQIMSVGGLEFNLGGSVAEISSGFTQPWK